MPFHCKNYLNKKEQGCSMELPALKESLSLLKKNPILYLPDLLLTAVTHLLLFWVYVYTGASSILPLFQSAETVSIDLLKSYLSENIAQIITAGIAFFFITFILGVTVTIFKFSMINEAVKGKKVSLGEAWKQKKGFFWPVVFLRVLLFLISLLAFIAALAISGGIYYLVNLWNHSLALFVAISLGMLLLLFLIICIYLAFLYKYALMFMKPVKHPVQVLRHSYLLLKKEPKFVILSGLVACGVTLAFAALVYVLGTGVSLGLQTMHSLILVNILGAIWALLSILGNETATLWTSLYLFVKCKKKNTKE